jgi:FtsP/CotA-like multicopper oxidase with cupredoxin domain
MKLSSYTLTVSIAFWLCTALQTAKAIEVCPLPATRIIENPANISSVAGILNTQLFAYNSGAGPMPEIGSQANYNYRFCLLTDPTQAQTPVLRANPGDTINLRLMDQMTVQPGFPMPHVQGMSLCAGLNPLDMGNITTLNLHFHGLNIPPTCGNDDVIHTMLQAGINPEFTYSFKVPANDSPGMYFFIRIFMVQRNNICSVV